MSPYAEAQLAPLNRGLGNLANGFLQIPRLRAMQQLYQQRAMEQAAAAQEQAARTRLTDAQTSGLVADQANNDNLTRSFRALMANPADQSAQANVIGAYAQAYRNNPQGTANALGTLMGQMQALNGSANYANIAALQGHADQLARPIIAPAGSTVFSPTGAVLGSSAYNLPPGQSRYAAVSGPPATVDPTTIAEDEPAGPPPAQPIAIAPAAGSSMVRVQHPNGLTGAIPAANLNTALQQGYRQLP